MNSTRDWNEVSALSVYRELSNTAVLCTFLYAIAIYSVGEFRDQSFGSELDLVLLLIATASMGYLGRRVGVAFLEDTVSPIWRMIEAALTVPAFWVSMAYVIAIYKGELSHEEMRLPYLDLVIWPWFFIVFASAFLSGRVLEPRIEQIASKIEQKMNGTKPENSKKAHL